MDRRNFLKTSAFCIGVSTITAAERRKETAEKVRTPLEVMGYVTEPAKQLPLIASADIVVVGGGPAGVSAAVSAAREGADVLLIEKHNFLGGLWLGGLVLPVINTRGKTPDGQTIQVMHGFGKEVIDELLGMKMCIIKNERPVVDPEAAKYVLDCKIEDSGVRMLYNTYVTDVIMSGDRIEHVIVESKSGRCAIKTKLVVDCSGDGDIIEWSGESFEKKRCHIGMMWRTGGVNIEHKEATPVPGVINQHMNGEPDQDGLDIFNVSRLQQKFRKEMWNRVQELRKTPGCENAYLLETPRITGVRITRLLDARHKILKEDSMKYVEYEDTIGLGGTPRGRRPHWQIPYRALLPKRCPNLIVAGRCICCDDKMLFDMREVGTCLITGQAAGTAAALAEARRTSIQDVDINLLQNTLVSRGAKIR
jgi:ribulose 1,5-bisphosphate synthetase/thiazole synthase